MRLVCTLLFFVFFFVYSFSVCKFCESAIYHFPRGTFYFFENDDPGRFKHLGLGWFWGYELRIAEEAKVPFPWETLSPCHW